MHPQFEFFLLATFHINFAKKQTYLVFNILARATVVFVFVKSSDKLLNYLMFVQVLSETKIEMLKKHNFYP